MDMKCNQYYNKSTMNYEQLARDLEKQGLRCEYDEKINILFVSYLILILMRKLELNFLKLNIGKFIFMITFFVER